MKHRFSEKPTLSSSAMRIVRRMRRRILHNPLALSIRGAHYHTRSQYLTSVAGLQKWVTRLRHRPFTLLNECYGRSCPNTRSYNPAPRSVLEKAVKLYAQILYINELHAVFVGSGSLLQELVYMTLLAEAKTINRVTASFIDPLYQYTCLLSGRERSSRCQALKSKHDQLLCSRMMLRAVQLQEWLCRSAPHISWSFDFYVSREGLSKLSKPAHLCIGTDIEETKEFESWLIQAYPKISFLLLDQTGALRYKHISVPFRQNKINFIGGKKDGKLPIYGILL